MKKVHINFSKIIIALLIIVLISPKSLFVQISQASTDSMINYKLYYKGYGWSNSDKKENREIEAIKIDINEDDRNNLLYSVYIKDDGWSPYVSSGNAVGKISRNKPIEKIRIKLARELEEKYNIEYRLNFGTSLWTRWFHNNEIGYNKVFKSIYNIEIRLVRK